MKEEEQSLHTKLYKKLLKALASYPMIADGDKILVGLSGGKDSLCLLEFLAERMCVTHPHFSVEAIHIRMRNVDYKSDPTYLQEFCKSRGVPLHVVTTEFQTHTADDKPMCFLCSWHRRKQMFRFAQYNGFNKIALGHHMDDIIHTTLLNLFYQGTFATMPAVMTMSKMPITIIRPLCLQHEADIKQYASLRRYNKPIKTCPYEADTSRKAMRQLFEHIEATNPEARFSLWHALEKEGKLIH